LADVFPPTFGMAPEGEPADDIPTDAGASSTPFVDPLLQGFAQDPPDPFAASSPEPDFPDADLSDRDSEWGTSE
jgi:hypothetical protein